MELGRIVQRQNAAFTRLYRRFNSTYAHMKAKYAEDEILNFIKAKNLSKEFAEHLMNKPNFWECTEEDVSSFLDMKNLSTEYGEYVTKK